MKKITMPWRHAITERSPPWARRWLGPATKYVDMLLIDHGIFRLIYLNRHRLGTKGWRTAQPAPHQIRWFAQREGIRTIVNLRGSQSSGGYWLEEDACLRHGVRLVNFKVRSRGAPMPEEVLAARDLLAAIDYPVLVHCKSGADRAGLFSVLYMHFVEGQPIETARHQLSLRYGHIRQADTGILDTFFERYLADHARAPIPFLEWVERVYDADELERTFRPSGWANGLVNMILRRE